MQYLGYTYTKIGCLFEIQIFLGILYFIWQCCLGFQVTEDKRT